MGFELMAIATAATAAIGSGPNLPEACAAATLLRSIRLGSVPVVGADDSMRGGPPWKCACCCWACSLYKCDNKVLGQAKF